MTVVPLPHETSTGGWPEAVLSAPHPRDASVTVLTECGSHLTVDVGRWHAPADEADHSVLRRCCGPVLDIGSGPGRIVSALAARSIPALGIDISAAAVERAAASGATCVLADVFGAVPDPGGWGTALLLDGNIGIGGDPVALLRRVAELVTPSGSVIVEVEPLHRPVVTSRRVRVVHGSDLSSWFAWAVVSVDELPALADESGWVVTETWCRDDRWFTRLDRAQVGA